MKKNYKINLKSELKLEGKRFFFFFFLSGVSSGVNHDFELQIIGTTALHATKLLGWFSQIL